jgi:hypothetical protein
LSGFRKLYATQVEDWTAHGVVLRACTILHVPACQGLIKGSRSSSTPLGVDEVQHATHETTSHAAKQWSHLLIISRRQAAIQRQVTASITRQSRCGTSMRSIVPHTPVAHSWPPVSLQHSRCFTRQRPSRLSAHRHAVVLACHRQQHEDCSAKEQPLQRRTVLQTLAAATWAVVLPAVAPAVACAGIAASLLNSKVLLVWDCGAIHIATYRRLTTSLTSTADLEQFRNPKEGYRIDRPTSWEQTSEGLCNHGLCCMRATATCDSV